MVTFIRFGVSFLVSLFGLYINPPKPTVKSVLVTTIIKSPATIMMGVALIHRFEFRYHCIIQALTIPITLCWIVPFCEKCEKHSDIMSVFDKVNRFGIYSL